MSGACTFINGALFDWSAKKQTSVTTSSTEAEYCSGSEGAKDAKHALSLIGDITANSNVVLEQTAISEMDNQGACFMAKSPINNRRSRHIDIRFHFIRNYVKRKILQIRWIATENNVADIMTKALGKVKFALFRAELGMRKVVMDDQ